MALTFIETPPKVVFSENSIPVIIETDNLLDAGTLRKNFSICLEIELESAPLSNVFDEKYTVKAFPHIKAGNNYRAIFDLQRILDNILMNNKDINLIDNSYLINFLTLNPWITSGFRSRRWRINAYEEFGNPPVASTVYTPFSFSKVYQGGTSDECRNTDGYTLNQNDISVFSFFNKKTLLPNQPDFFTIYSSVIGTQSIVSGDIEITYDDLSTHIEPYPNISLYSINSGDSLMISSGYQQLSLDSFNPSKTVSKWRIKVVLNSLGGSPKTVYSPEYCLDCRYYQCKEFIWFINSFGTLETIHLTGVWEAKIKSKKNNFIRSRDIQNNLFDNRNVTFKVDSQQTFRARTGFHSRETILNLQQLFTNKIIFWQIEDQKLVPIKIDQGTFKIDECLEVLHSLTFNFKPSWSLNNYDLKVQRLGTIK